MKRKWNGLAGGIIILHCVKSLAEAECWECLQVRNCAQYLGTYRQLDVNSKGFLMGVSQSLAYSYGIFSNVHLGVLDI